VETPVVKVALVTGLKRFTSVEGLGAVRVSLWRGFTFRAVEDVYDLRTVNPCHDETRTAWSPSMSSNRLRPVTSATFPTAAAASPLQAAS